MNPKTSSYNSTIDSPDLGRFNTLFENWKSGWFTTAQTTDQCFQLGSSIPFVFENFKISGRKELAHWISSYKLNYSLDGVNWIRYKNSAIFVANSEQNQPVEHVFDSFIA